MAGIDDDRHALEKLLRSGRKIEAIKRLREKTGCSLEKAKEAVEIMQSALPPAVPPFEVRPFASDLEGQVLAVLNDRSRIDAIALYRKLTGESLKEAKEAVEAIEIRHGLRPPRQGCLVLFLAFAAALLLAA